MSTGEWIILGVLGPIDLVFFAFVWRFRKDIEKVIVTGLNRWLADRHTPHNVGEGVMYCLACRTAWPCNEWVAMKQKAKVTP